MDENLVKYVKSNDFTLKVKSDTIPQIFIKVISPDRNIKLKTCVFDIPSRTVHTVKKKDNYNLEKEIFPIIEKRLNKNFYEISNFIKSPKNIGKYLTV